MTIIIFSALLFYIVSVGLQSKKLATNVFSTLITLLHIQSGLNRLAK